MTRPGESITLSLTPSQKTKLNELALEFGCQWGQKPNISKLVKMIADGRIALYKPGDPINASDKSYYRRQLAELKALVANLETLGKD